MKIDLRNDVETLRGNLGKTSRNEISRALREGVFCKSLPEPSLADIQQFLLASNELKLRKNFEVAEHEFFHHLQLKKQLHITKACNNIGDVLSWHAYIKIKTSVMQLASITMIHDKKTSEERRAAGRANRYLHWHDFCLFKEEGVKSCDLGGWATGEDEHGANSAPLYEFKKSLGAKVTDAYHAIKPITPLGYLVVKAFSLRP